MKYCIITFLCLFTQLCQAQTRKFDYSLNLIVEQDIIVKKNANCINLIFYNNSIDTLFLPINEFYLRECLEITFLSPSKLAGKTPFGTVTKRAPINDNDRTFYCEDFALIKILPFQFRVYNYDMYDCSNFEKGINYEYQIKLNIHFERKVICHNIWQGEIFSNKGDFTFL